MSQQEINEVITKPSEMDVMSSQFQSDMISPFTHARIISREEVVME
jgi:hypothetical protein